ncbi:effector-associated constant component EACC1 [Streptomyces sp. NPDC003703]|uniref:effector-associated constant component EACC1 n=1 Tax=Streptomyces sp. NPDC003283 TaxID=3364681 RepID=UPI0036C236B4
MRRWRSPGPRPVALGRFSGIAGCGAEPWTASGDPEHRGGCSPWRNCALSWPRRRTGAGKRSRNFAAAAGRTRTARSRQAGDLAASRPGTMGAASDALIALLEPGGVATVFAGAVIAWVQTRCGNHTITVTRPDGTEITISSGRTRDVARRLGRRLTVRRRGDPHRLTRPALRAVPWQHSARLSSVNEP